MSHKVQGLTFFRRRVSMNLQTPMRTATKSKQRTTAMTMISTSFNEPSSSDTSHRQRNHVTATLTVHNMTQKPRYGHAHSTQHDTETTLRPRSQYTTGHRNHVTATLTVHNRTQKPRYGHAHSTQHDTETTLRPRSPSQHDTETTLRPRSQCTT